MFKLGIDIGYRYVKGVNEKGESIMYPSFVGTPYERKLSNIFGTKNNNLLDNLDVLIKPDGCNDEKNVFVGKLAVDKRDINNFSNSDDRWFDENNSASILMAVAATILVQDETKDLHLVTGLPLDDFKDEDKKKKVESLIKNFNAMVKIKGTQYVKKVGFTKVTLFPQGAGCAYSTIFAKPDKYLVKNSYIGLVDIGGKTTNFLVFHINKDSKVEFVGHLSGTENIGMNKVLDDIETAYEQKTKGDKLNFTELLDLYDSQEIYNANVGKVEVKSDIETSKRNMVQSIKNTILTSKWNDIINKFSTIIIAGGGGKDLFEYFTNLKDVNATFVLADKPQTANAEGYLKVAEMMEMAEKQRGTEAS